MKMGAGVAKLVTAARGAEAGLCLVRRARERTWPDPDPTHVGPHPVAPGSPGSTQSKLLRAPGSPRQAASQPEGPTLDVLHARRAGLDVHKKTVVACVRSVGPGGEVTREV